MIKRPVSEITNAETGEIIDLEELIAARLNEHGHELLNPTPQAPPLGYKKQPSLSDQIRDMVRSEHLRQAAASAGMETFEEADDFDVDDDYDPTSPYEVDFDPGENALLQQMHGYANSLGYKLEKINPEKEENPIRKSSSEGPDAEGVGKSGDPAPGTPSAPADKSVPKS